MQFTDWCDCVDGQVRSHFRRVMTGRLADIPTGIQVTATAVPTHYASEEHLASVFRRLGKAATATLIENKLPTTKKIRSGDLAEIYATEWISSSSGGYQTPIKRLRWKDHRNMAMRGEDAIGVYQDPQTLVLRFLKTEVKSRAVIAASVIAEARNSLDGNGGLPSAHALSYISARLLELGQLPLANAIDDASINFGIRPENVIHLIFTFSGNSPEASLTTSLHAYTGTIGQWAVGLCVDGHAAFIQAVYDQVIANANNP